MIDVSDEKNPGYAQEAESKPEIGTTTTIEEEVASSDGDDALKLAGTHAHHFDEEYYKRLRWKIVSLRSSRS